MNTEKEKLKPRDIFIIARWIFGFIVTIYAGIVAIYVGISLLGFWTGNILGWFLQPFEPLLSLLEYIGELLFGG